MSATKSGAGDQRALSFPLQRTYDEHHPIAPKGRKYCHRMRQEEKPKSDY
jgi:hypothetical protein